MATETPGTGDSIIIDETPSQAVLEFSLYGGDVSKKLLFASVNQL